MTRGITSIAHQHNNHNLFKPSPETDHPNSKYISSFAFKNIHITEELVLRSVYAGLISIVIFQAIKIVPQDFINSIVEKISRGKFENIADFFKGRTYETNPKHFIEKLKNEINAHIKKHKIAEESEFHSLLKTIGTDSIQESKYKEQKAQFQGLKHKNKPTPTEENKPNNEVVNEVIIADKQIEEGTGKWSTWWNGVKNITASKGGLTGRGWFGDTLVSTLSGATIAAIFLAIKSCLPQLVNQQPVNQELTTSEENWSINGKKVDYTKKSSSLNVAKSELEGEYSELTIKNKSLPDKGTQDNNQKSLLFNNNKEKINPNDRYSYDKMDDRSISSSQHEGGEQVSKSIKSRYSLDQFIKPGLQPNAEKQPPQTFTRQDQKDMPFWQQSKEAGGLAGKVNKIQKTMEANKLASDVAMDVSAMGIFASFVSGEEGMI